ncbi:hypothetical protein C8C76_12430 [Halanaerobium saccharolyticum]|uniref:DUF8042 domain-containing protein n=1 Tax=Halanaerobium saccharolyticum TaxID=43595 RepID=A0A2T5RHU8_9FIRM|nr:hypothetical protein [Halanaerobium saccharolyticum]PTV96831.1 hypothetical protein C8C76_12430 [Halanaerobium saccharolyticum]
MLIYFNNVKIELDSSNKDDILNTIESKLDNEIIKTIYLDDVEFSLKYFREAELDLERFEEIYFETQKINKLINETVKEAENYLPKLKTALKESAQLFRKKDYDEASQLFNLAVDGLEWYLNILNSIVDLKEKNNDVDEVNKLLNKFNMALNRAMISLNQEEYNDFADLLEVEIIEYLDKLQGCHQELLEK